MSVPTQSLDALVAVINRWAPGASLQDETEQIVSVLHLPAGDVPVFVRLMPEADLLQLVAFLPCELRPQAMADTGRFLHLINKGLDRPGLGIDEVFKVVFYRVVLPLRQGEWDEDQLRAAWEGLEGVVETFAESIKPVAKGSMDFHEVIDLLATEGDRS
jgi:hypothetical protein